MHVFGDLTEFMLADPHKSKIIDMRAPLDDNGTPTDLTDARRRHLQMKKYLRTHGQDIHKKKASVGCLLHPGQQCQIAYQPVVADGQDRQLRPLRTCTAGPMCLPWCSLGGRLGFSHPSLESFFVWMEHVVQERYDMTTMENNKWFPKAEYQKRMSQIGKVVSIVTSADKLGFPCARERLFSTTLSYEALIWVGPSTDEEIYHDFHALFGRRCQVEADVYVCDSQENACVYRRELARTRGIFGGSVDQLVQLLPPDGRHRLLSYEQMKDRLIGMKGIGVVDISQNPKKRPRGGAWLPTCQRKPVRLHELDRRLQRLPCVHTTRDWHIPGLAHDSLGQYPVVRRCAEPSTTRVQVWA